MEAILLNSLESVSIVKWGIRINGVSQNICKQWNILSLLKISEHSLKGCDELFLSRYQFVNKKWYDSKISYFIKKYSNRILTCDIKKNNITSEQDVKKIISKNFKENLQAVETI